MVSHDIFQHLGISKNVKYIIGTSPLAFFWPQRRVNGTGLHYPVAEGTGKWIEFHSQARDGAMSVRNGGDAAALGASPGTPFVHSQVIENEREAVRSRRNGRESDDAGTVMV